MGTPIPAPRSGEHPYPQLDSRGIVGQEEGAGARAGLWHQVKRIQAWEKGESDPSTAQRPHIMWGSQHGTGAPTPAGRTHFDLSG